MAGGGYVLERNLQKIKFKDRDLFARLRKTEAKKPPEITFLKSKSGNIIARLQTTEGKSYLLHSYYDPVAEGRGVVKRINWAGVTHVLVLGIGCGYHIRAVLETVKNDVEVYAIEPDLTLFKAVIENIDITDILSKRNLKLFVGLQPVGVVGKFYQVFKVQDLKSIEVIKHPVYAKLAPAYFSEIEKKLKEAIRLMLTNLITLMNSNIRDQRNILRNVYWVVRNPGVKELFGRFRGRPAVVVSAGPSLDKNIYYLRGFEDRILIVSTDTGMNALLSWGIKPHFVTVGDPFETDYNCFMFTEPEDEEGIWLVADPRATYRITEGFGGGSIVGSLGSKIMEWMKQFIGDKGTLTAWGSVATQAMSLAVSLGANPIIFIGQDLSYVDGRRYASYTYGDFLGGNVVPLDGKGYTLERDIFDRDVPTVHNMKTYRDWFHQQMGVIPVAFINATEGGILRENVEFMSFREALLRYARQPFSPREVIKKSLKYPNVRKTKSTLLSGLRDVHKLASRVREISSLSLKEMDKMFSNVSSAEEIKDLDWASITDFLEEKEKEIKSLVSKGRFLEEGFFVMFLNFNRLVDAARKHREELNRNIELAKAYMELFKGVEQIAVKYQRMISEAMDRLSADEGVKT